jgi:hypothetical protein
VVAIAAENLKFLRVSVFLDPAPQPVSAGSEFVGLAMRCTVSIYMVELQEPHKGRPASRTLAVWFASTIVCENFIAEFFAVGHRYHVEIICTHSG